MIDATFITDCNKGEREDRIVSHILRVKGRLFCVFHRDTKDENIPLPDMIPVAIRTAQERGYLPAEEGEPVYYAVWMWQYGHWMSVKFPKRGPFANGQVWDNLTP